jgi:hypothetical protein
MIDGIYSLSSFIERRSFDMRKKIQQSDDKKAYKVPLKISAVQKQAAQTGIYNVGLSKTQSKSNDHVQEFLFNLS